MQFYQIETYDPELVISLDDMKLHLRRDDDDDDEYIKAVRNAAIAQVDGPRGYLSRALVDQEWEVRFAGFYYNEFYVPLPPLLEVVSLKHYDANNVLQTISTSVYDVLGIGSIGRGRIALNSGNAWPTTYARDEAVQLRFRAGYLDLSTSPPTGQIPYEIIAAIKLKAEALYKIRSEYIVGQTFNKTDVGDNLLRYYKVYD